MFAGGLSVSLPGVHPAATAAGPRLHTLTVTGTNLAGKPDTGDVVDVENVGTPVSRRPSYGTLRAFTSGQLTSPPGPAVPYGYTLDFVDPPGTIPSQRFTVRPADLATVSERYFQDRESVAGWQTLGGTLYQMRTSFTGALVLPLRLPGRQVQYLSAKPAMLWNSEYAEYDRTFPGQTSGGQTGALRLLHAGQRLTEAWNRYPLHPGVNVDFAGNHVFPVRASAARTGNILRLDLTPFSDNQRGHTGTGLAAAFPGKDTDFRGSFALYQDGVKIAGGDAVKATGGFGDLQVSKTLSPQALTIAAGHIQLSRQFPVTRSRVQVSFDDGRTWRRARVRPLTAGRFRATFAAPPSAHVTLRVTARDAAGNTLTETIPRAYRTSA